MIIEMQEGTPMERQLLFLAGEEMDYDLRKVGSLECRREDDSSRARLPYGDEGEKWYYGLGGNGER